MFYDIFQTPRVDSNWYYVWLAVATVRQRMGNVVKQAAVQFSRFYVGLTLFADTVSAVFNSFADTVSVAYDLFSDTVSAEYNLFSDTVSAGYTRYT